ncbi:MAG TPA: helix-turn-helix transcriptional regulator [Solirubrobacterales bacterium]|jgi:transcriptional regulator with XRE-family HTH domain
MRRRRPLRAASTSLGTRDLRFAHVFGKNLARCREQLGVSQEDLGLLAGLHRTAVGQLERGERVARTDTLVRLCGSLGVGPDALLIGLCWRPAEIRDGELEIEPAKASQPAEAEEATKQRSERAKDEPARSSESQR